MTSSVDVYQPYPSWLWTEQTPIQILTNPKSLTRQGSQMKNRGTTKYGCCIE